MHASLCMTIIKEKTNQIQRIVQCEFLDLLKPEN